MNRDTFRRFAYIETCLYWGGGITASQLAATFEITRQNAQKCLDAYRLLHPEQMNYQSSLKRHIATPYFQANYINNKPEIYLDYLRGNQLAAYYWAEEEWTDLPIYDLDRLFRTYLESTHIKQVLSAMRRQLSLTIHYHSKSQNYQLIISPNRLVYASRRYHLRAYCHNWERYVDLVFSRLLQVSEGFEEWVSDAEDHEWHEPLTLKFTPHPDLPEQLRQTLIRDYQLAEGIHTIMTCEALKPYVLREMERIDWKHKIRLWVLV